MAVIKSSSDHITINADGASKDIKFQANGVEKASISSAGAFTSTTIDATKLTGALPAGMGGKVLQVVQGSAAVQVSTTSSTYQATGLNVTIQPSATSSKVLVIWHSSYNSQAGGTLDVALYRAGSSTGRVHYLSSDSSSGWQNLNGSVLDSPATTSSITYELYYKSTNGNSVNVGPNDFTHYIIATEVGA